MVVRPSLVADPGDDAPYHQGRAESQDQRRVSAYAELSSTGRCGSATIALLRRVGARAVQAPSLPAPAGHASWTKTVIDEYLAAFLSSNRDVIVNSWALAHDEASLERLVFLAVERFLVDEAQTAERTERLARIDQNRAANPLRPRLVGSFGAGGEVDAVEDPESTVIADSAAEQLWTSLSPSDRALLPHLGEPPSVLATITGTNRQSATESADELAARLRSACANDAQAVEVITRLRALCTERP